jgi:hypothetical protein
MAEGGEDRDAPGSGAVWVSLDGWTKPKGEVFAVSFAEGRLGMVDHRREDAPNLGRSPDHPAGTDQEGQRP